MGWEALPAAELGREGKARQGRGAYVPARGGSTLRHTDNHWAPGLGGARRPKGAMGEVDVPPGAMWVMERIPQEQRRRTEKALPAGWVHSGDLRRHSIPTATIQAFQGFRSKGHHHFGRHHTREHLVRIGVRRLYSHGGCARRPGRFVAKGTDGKVGGRERPAAFVETQRLGESASKDGSHRLVPQRFSPGYKWARAYVVFAELARDLQQARCKKFQVRTEIGGRKV